MRVLFWGMALFFTAFFIQLIIWRVHLPMRQNKALLQVFFGNLVAGTFSLWGISRFSSALSIYMPHDFLEYVHIAVLFISLTLAYMITYTAIEVDSPSLVMIMTVAKSGARGLDKDEFERTMSDDVLVKPRIKDLLLDKMIALEGDTYRLMPKGTLLARIFIFYRKILNTGKGG